MIKRHQFPSPTRALAAGVTALMCSSALGQGQPNTVRSRTVGLDVYGHIQSASTLTPGTTVIEIHGQPNARYFLLLDTSPLCVDTTFAYFSNVIGAQSLFNPIIIDPINNAFSTVTGASQPYFIPPTGELTLLSNWSFPLGWSFPIYWQVVMDNFAMSGGAPTVPATPLNVGGAVYFSNPQSRNPNPPPTLPINFYTGLQVPGTGSPDNQDIEQADVDNDGDLDHFVLTSGGGLLYLQVPGSGGLRDLTSTPITIGLPIQMALSHTAEFADLDDDGFLDLIIGGDGLQYIAIYRNLGGIGSSPSAWQGFALLPPDQVILQSFEVNVNDIETGDVNGDALPDIIAATGRDTCIGEVNLLLMNQTTQSGTPIVNDLTQSLMPLQFEDTLDCEFIDIERDGDLDALFVNYDGPATIAGQDFIYVNDGTGAFNTIPIITLTNPLIPIDQSDSTDGLVGDFNLDGFDDIFITNWYGTAFCNGGFQRIAEDELYLNDPSNPGTFIDASALLPDNFAYTVPGFSIQPHAGVDAECVRMPLDATLASVRVPKDIDADGDVDIVIALGSRGSTNFALGSLPQPTTPTAGVNRGIIIYENQLVSVSSPTLGVPILGLPPFVLNPNLQFAAPAEPFLSPPDYVDIELGDWLVMPDITISPVLLRNCCDWFERDIGAVTRDSGHFVHKPY